jgi:DNA-binding NarL/FixJ family response regulator
MDIIKKSFVFFDSWERYLKALEDDKDINYVNAVARAMIQYGLRGECETDDETILRKVDAVCSDLMQSTQSRYVASIQGGKQGGRPKQYDADTMQALRDAGMTYQEIADELGCSVRTVQRELKTNAADDDDEI